MSNRDCIHGRSNSPRNPALRMPIFGDASRIHDTVNRMPGITSGMIESAKNRRLNGVLVRSFIQASEVPRQSEKIEVPIANWTELKNSRKVSALKYAVRKFSSVKTAGRLAVCGVRKLCHNKKTSGTSDSQHTSRIGMPISTHLESRLHRDALPASGKRETRVTASAMVPAAHRPTSVPIPKFAHTRGTLSCELRNQGTLATL